MYTSTTLCSGRTLCWLLLLTLTLPAQVHAQTSYQETPDTTPEERALWYAPAPAEVVTREALAAWQAGRAAARAAAAQPQQEAPFVPTKTETGTDGQLLMTFTVNSSNETTSSHDATPGDGICDDVAGGARCTLRAAIDEANASAGTSLVTINFALPFTINLNASNAPFAITRSNVTLDGVTLGSVCGDLLDGNPHFPNIVLDGSNYNGTQDGLQITGNDVTVRGLTISNFPDRGIETSGDDGYFECLYVGTNLGGDAAQANRQGIHITGQDNTVLNSLISGNLLDGIVINGTGATGNIIRRNLIGSHENGSTGLGNGADGVEISGGASGNFIGISTSPDDTKENVILDNGSDGIELFGADNNFVYGNNIGITLGNGARGNASHGIALASGASGNSVGADLHRNLVGNNGFDGIHLTGSTTDNNTFTANSITSNDRHGIHLLSGAGNNLFYGLHTFNGNPNFLSNLTSNAVHGIVITGSSTSGNTVTGYSISFNGTFGALIDDAPDNTIGSGAATGGTNIINGNTDDGIRVQGANATNNKIYDNRIGYNTSANGNGSSGIDVRNNATGTIIGDPDGSISIIADNAHNGINISGSAGSTTIQNCAIGVTGTIDIGNTGPGLIIETSSNNNIVRTSYISGNAGIGVLLKGNNNTFTDNRIGTSVTGTSAVPNDTNGMQIQGDNNTIGALVTFGEPGPGNGGNVISGNTGFGLFLTSTASGNNLYGNYIGLDLNGNALPNTADGVLVEGPDNQIGRRVLLGEGRNVISGNAAAGILIRGASATGNQVRANYIGLAPDGETIRPNNVGVSLLNVDDVIIGQGDNTSAASGNVISGNSTNGITLDGTDNIVIDGNKIGTNVAGDADRGNGQSGIWMPNATNTIIGDTGFNGRNVISGNNTQGIGIASASDNNTIVNNYIGTNDDGDGPVPNGFGIQFASGSTGNQIGGVNANEANLIAFNNNDGIFDGNPAVAPAQTGQNNIRHNSIHDNAGLGIDISPNGINAPPVAVTQIQDFPTVRHVHFTITAAQPNTTYTVELFHSPSADPSGFGEGMTFLDSEVVTTDGAGNRSALLNVPNTDLPDGFATLTLIQNNKTSEFSGAFVVPPLTPLKAFLAGAYDTGTGLMKTALNSGGHLEAHALTQPYSGAPWNCTGSCNASVSSGFFAAHPDVVDWVYVQVRDSDAPAPGSVVDAKAALVLKDGTVVSHTDAVSPLAFTGLPDGPYFIAVFHRHHLSVMTDAAQVFAAGFAGYDFTDGSAYGTNAQQDLGGGVFGLWGGDGDATDSVTAFDFLNVWLPQNGGAAGYHAGDFNMTGDVTAFDFLQVWLVANGQASQVP